MQITINFHRKLRIMLVVLPVALEYFNVDDVKFDFLKFHFKTYITVTFETKKMVMC